MTNIFSNMWKMLFDGKKTSVTPGMGSFFKKTTYPGRVFIPPKGRTIDSAPEISRLVTTRERKLKIEARLRKLSSDSKKFKSPAVGARGK